MDNNLPNHLKLLYRIKHGLHDLPLDNEKYGYTNYDYHFKGDLPLIKACKYGRINEVDELISIQDANIEANQGLPMINAIENDHIEIVKILIQYDVEKKFSHLLTAIKFGYIEILAYLLDNGYSTFIGNNSDSVISSLLETPGYIFDDIFNKLFAFGLENYLSGSSYIFNLTSRAVKLNYVSVLEKLPKLNDLTNKTVKELALMAVESNAYLTLAFIVKKFVTNLSDLFKVSIIKSRLECVEVIIDAGVSPKKLEIFTFNNVPCNAYVYLAKLRNYNLLKCLLDKKKPNDFTLSEIVTVVLYDVSGGTNAVGFMKDLLKIPNVTNMLKNINLDQLHGKKKISFDMKLFLENR